MSRTCAGTPRSAAGGVGRFTWPEEIDAFLPAAEVSFTGSGDMPAERRQRILIGVLDTMSTLRRAIDDLAVADLDQKDMLVVADAGASFGALEQFFADAGMEDDGPCVVLRRNKPAPEDGNAQDEYFIPDSSSFCMPQIERWIASGLAVTHEEHLQSGGVLLVVWVRTAEQERVYSETMLVHSVDNVQLHDI